jgi:hypothetical protein
MASNLDKWLAGQTDEAAVQAKEAEKIGRMDFEDGTYIGQIVTAEIAEDKNGDFGVKVRYAFLEGEYYGETYMQWHGFKREDAWKWFSVWLRSCDVNVDPTEVTGMLRKTPTDIFGLVANQTVVKFSLKRQKYTDKDGNEKEAQNFRVIKVLESDAVEKLFDPAEYNKPKDGKKVEKKAETAKSTAAKTEAKPEPKKEAEKPAIEDTEDAGEELLEGMTVKFTLTEGKGKAKTEREVTATVTKIDAENEVVSVKEEDGTEHEIGTDEIEEIVKDDEAV